jgi:hypothetical protein
MTEYVQHESHDPDAWVCVCGNTPSDYGFYPISADNVEVEPFAEAWTTGEYYCARCGRVIDQVTRRVVRHPDIREIERPN